MSKEKDWIRDVILEFGLDSYVKGDAYLEPFTDELADSIRQELVRILEGKKKEGNEHDEHGECGCKYLEWQYPCEIQNEAHNEAIDEVIKEIGGGE